jgi:winged helix DNA-binding protein
VTETGRFTPLELVDGRPRWASTRPAQVWREVLSRRLATQRLTGDAPSTAAEVVRVLGCVQSQEYGHALWSLGMRTSGLTVADVQAEFDSGSFLRTHILRPTWHFVPAEDIRWILQVTAPRIQKLNQTVYRQHGLDPATLERGLAIIIEQLEGGRYRTRAELGRALADRELASHGIGLAYIVMNTELAGVICSGPVRGTQQTYALLDERVPRSTGADTLRASANRAPRHGRGASGGVLSSASDDGGGFQASSARKGDIPELAARFFLGHGPASIQDLARWSSLTIGQCRNALDVIKDQLGCISVEGEDLWFDPAAPPPRPVPGALLMPLYDELTLSYPLINFPQSTGHPHQPGEDLFVGCVIISETNVGLWRRTLRGRKMIMEITVSAGVLPKSRDILEAAAADLATFVGKELELTITG